MGAVGKGLDEQVILIVGHDPADGKRLVEHLLQYQFKVLEAPAGESGLQMARQEQPDLILLDIAPIGMDGFDVCRHLKADERTHPIPVIFMTTDSSVEAKIEGLRAGAVDQLAKPFQFPELLARVQIHLQLWDLAPPVDSKPAAQIEELRAAHARLQRNLSKSEKLQQTLRQSEERFKLTLEAARVGLFDWEISNERSHTSFGHPTERGHHSPESLDGLGKWLERVHPDDRDQVGQVIREALTRRAATDRPQPFVFKARVSLADGTYRWEHVQGTCSTHHADAEVTHLTGARMDISELMAADEERAAHLHFLESVVHAGKAIHSAGDLETMMTDVLDVILSSFDCDRAWLLYPCDPEASTWSVPMERTKPEYPGANALGVDIPMTAEVAQNHQQCLSSERPLRFGPGSTPLPEDVSKEFGIQSFIAMPLRPKVGKAWQFGMHQCSYPRSWTDAEEELFREVGRRLEDGLTSLLSYRKLQESEEQFRLVFENSPVSIWQEDFSEVKAFLDRSLDRGTDDIEQYFAENPEVVQRCAELVKISDVNRASLTLHKAASKDELLAGLTRTFTPESLATFQKELVCIWNGETEMTCDAVVKTLDGELRYVTVCWVVCPGSEKDLSRVVVSIIDNTDRKRADEERTEHVQFLQSMGQIHRRIQESDDLERMMTDVLDATLEIFDCDRAWLVYPCDPNAPYWRVPMERTKPEYPGASTLGLEVPMDDGVREAHRIALAADGPVKYGPGTDHPLPAEDSARFDYKCFISTVFHPKVGNAWLFGMHQCSHVRHWTAQEERLFQEIGHRLADALTALLTLRNLRESEERYRLVFENSPVALLEEDCSGVRILLDDLKKQGVVDIEGYLNQHTELLQRYTDLVKVTNVNHASLALHGAENREELLSGIQETYTQELLNYFRGKIISLWHGHTQMRSDTVLHTLSGERRFVVRSFSACSGYEESLSRVIVSMEDITERKKAEESLRLLNAELDQRVLDRTVQLAKANEELEAFAYSVSHDLRAPLRHIDGFVELLRAQAGGQLDPQGQRYMDTISDSARRMGELIDTLLSFSRMGRQTITPGRVELDALVREVIGEIEPDTAGRAIQWRIGDLPAVGCDPSMLRLVFRNLLLNAVKFTRPRSDPQIEIGSLPNPTNETVVFVRDNGVGFDMAHVHKLFAAFQRLHRVEEFEGTGIGLANVQRIIDRHGGRTWAEGEVNHGATFYFSLPRA